MRGYKANLISTIVDRTHLLTYSTIGYEANLSSTIVADRQ